MVIGTWSFWTPKLLRSIRRKFAGRWYLEKAAMSHTKHAPKGKRGGRAVPLLGVAGVSLALVGGASARTIASGVDAPSGDTAVGHEITLNEEEISDVSLATFYVFNKENVGTPKVSEKLAWGCRGCGGCGGCRGCGGCGGFRGCGGCRGCFGCGGCRGCGFGCRGCG
jgi:hypothetical protein